MLVFEIIIALLLAGAVLTGVSRRIGAPYPALVALAGAGLALIPWTPTLVLDPQLALALFVAPVLLDAAFDSSARDLRANWTIVSSLAIGAVASTVVVVAFVARWLVPTMPWAAAVALGAIVAPPDAAAATAVLNQLRPPHRLLVILEGESLFNDASALLVYRLALGAVVAGTVSPLRAAPTLLVVTVGSAVLGYVLSRAMMLVIGRFRDVSITVVFQFCATFGVWLLAERLHLSGILTVVVFAMVSARRAGGMAPEIRVPSYAVWEVAVFVLNVLAFILVGFQLKGILARLDATTLWRYSTVAAAVCGATMVARLVWVSGSAALGRRRYALSPRAALVVGWCGMRGIVTLVAALALPTAFPFRDLILLTAFSVVLATLVLQGMTLAPLMKLLALEDDGMVEREVHRARIEILHAAVESMRGKTSSEMSSLLRRRFEVELERMDRSIPEADARAIREGEAQAMRAATSAQRTKLLALRADGSIGDAAFQALEQELDLEELHLHRLAALRDD